MGPTSPSTTASFTPGAGTLEATITTQSTNAYHVKSLTASTTYYCKIKVYDNAGTPLTVISNEVNATTLSTGNDLPQTTIISYTYDKAGRKATMTDPFGTTLYTYNARGEPTQVKDPNAKTVSYQYNDGGLRTQMTDQFSGVTSYTYDNANRLTKVTDPDSNETDYTYDSNGRRAQLDLPNGTYTTYTYNNRNWLTATTHKKSDTSIFLSISYLFDKNGNPTKATENNGDVTDFTYDDLYRLTRETKEDDQQSTIYDYSYTYDAASNRTKKTDEETQTDTNYTYNNMNQMTAAGNITYTYDNTGNMATKVVSQQTTTYSWDFRNKMLKVDFPTGNDPVMRYGGGGDRVKKVVGATTTKFLRAAGGIIFETDGSDNEVAEYRRGARGSVVAMERSSTLHWYHFDGFVSTRAMTNASESATDTYTYDAFGVVVASTGSTQNVFQLAGAPGMYSDADVGLGLELGSPYDAAHSVVPLVVGIHPGCTPEERAQIERGLGWAHDQGLACLPDWLHSRFKDAFRYSWISCKHNCGPKSCGSARQRDNRISVCMPLPSHPTCPSSRCLLLHELLHIAVLMRENPLPGEGDDEAKEREENFIEDCEAECCPKGESTPPKKYKLCPGRCSRNTPVIAL